MRKCAQRIHWIGGIGNKFHQSFCPFVFVAVFDAAKGIFCGIGGGIFQQQIIIRLIIREHFLNENWQKDWIECV
jgi:hypothetical protein